MQMSKILIALSLAAGFSGLSFAQATTPATPAVKAAAPVVAAEKKVEAVKAAAPAVEKKIEAVKGAEPAKPEAAKAEVAKPEASAPAGEKPVPAKVKKAHGKHKDKAVGKPTPAAPLTAPGGK